VDFAWEQKKLEASLPWWVMPGKNARKAAPSPASGALLARFIKFNPLNGTLPFF
jgi:hypothetical protein